MHRFYADPVNSSEDSFVLSPEDTLHASKVLRMRPGDRAEVVFRGIRYLSAVGRISDNLAELHPCEVLPSTEPKLSLTLFQGLPKSDKMDWIVQKATELGAVRIVPVAFSRCVVRLNDKEGAKKQERWQKIAREAGKQCGRCIIPEVTLPVPVEGIASFRENLEEIVVPWELSEKYGPMAFVRDHPGIRSLGIVIGPEGGIEDGEISFLTALPAKPITLGRRILRTETAGMAAVSAFSALYGEME